VLLGAYVVTFTNRDVPAVAPAGGPPDPPFASFIWGAGFVEAGTQNVAVASPVDGLVANVLVTVGQSVDKDQPLMVLDDRTLQASMLVQNATIALNLGRVAQAQASLDALKAAANAGLAASDLNAAQARLDDANAELALAREQLHAIQVNQYLLTIRSPVAGQVLQLNKVAGEFAGVTAGPVAVVGDTTHLRVRVQIDENDAFRVHPGARAVGLLRGDPTVRTPLVFQYVQPMVVPKIDLSGDSSERVDTRVLPVIYTFDRGTLPIYVGEQMDICIDASAITATEPSR
jgi:multidrug resistance efflux pump